jgi:hypothetical protein
MIKYLTFFLKFLRILINSKDPDQDPGGQLITESLDLDLDSQLFIFISCTLRTILGVKHEVRLDTPVRYTR